MRNELPEGVVYSVEVAFWFNIFILSIDYSDLNQITPFKKSTSIEIVELVYFSRY
jgi:hypothetical protein